MKRALSLFRLILVGGSGSTLGPAASWQQIPIPKLNRLPSAQPKRNRAAHAGDLSAGGSRAPADRRLSRAFRGGRRFLKTKLE